MGLKKYTNKAEMKECKKTTWHLQKNTQQMYGSLLAFLYLCIDSCIFSRPSLHEMKFYRTFSLVSVLFGGFLNHLPIRRRTCLLSWRQTCFALEMNAILLGMNVLKTQVKTTATHTQAHIHVHTQAHTHTQSYQWLSKTPYVEMITPKMGGIALSYFVWLCYTHKLYIHAIVFSVGLNGLQVH